jgi:hypothetical protein
MKYARTKKLLDPVMSFFLNPRTYLTAGIIIAIVLPVFKIYNLRLPILIMLAAVPAWYFKPWLQTVRYQKKDFFIEEDYIP